MKRIFTFWTILLRKLPMVDDLTEFCWWCSSFERRTAALSNQVIP